MTRSWSLTLLTAWSDALTRLTIQATLSILCLLLLERVAAGISPRWRSWCWRLMSLRLACVSLVPVALIIPIWPASAPSPVRSVRGSELDDQDDAQLEWLQVAPRASPEIAQHSGPAADWRILVAAVWSVGVLFRLTILVRQHCQVVGHSAGPPCGSREWLRIRPGNRQILHDAA